MSTPPFLLGAALLFWGWQTGLLFIAAPAAALLEGARWVDWRLELEQDHFNRLWNLTFLLSLGLGLYLFFAQGGYAAVSQFVQQDAIGVRSESLRNFGSVILRFVQCVPATMLVFLLAFAYGPHRTLPLLTFSLIYRRGLRPEASSATRARAFSAVNPIHPFLLLLLLAVCATNANPRWFFPIVAALIAWALWNRRPARFRPWAWGSALALALGLGFSSQLALGGLQQYFEALQNRFFNEFGQSTFGTEQTETSLGSIGRLKLSGRIVLWVQSDAPGPPALLRVAAFDRYHQSLQHPLNRPLPSPTWSATQRKFEVVVNSLRDPATVAERERDYTWVLNPAAAPNRTVTTIGYKQESEAKLALPAGTVLVTDLTASIVGLQTNAMGAARIVGVETLAIMESRYAANGGFDSPPTIDDRTLDGLAPADARAVAYVAQELRLKGADPQAVIARLRLHFYNNFAYTTRLTPPAQESANDTPLAAFLMDQKRGHCEYFATATVMLLRAAGIPARYAVGYSVQEKRTATEYVVRERHAHSWALAWVKNQWIEIDNTPAGWFEAEWVSASSWEFYRDWFSNAWLAFYRWRQGDSQVRLFVFVGGVIILGFMAWRQVAGQRWRRSRARRLGADGLPLPGRDSEFFAIEQRLSKRHPRPPAESIHDWIARLPFADRTLRDWLLALTELHYGHRFDPAGLSPAQRERLRVETARWLASYLQSESR